jgi:hypothetical protein
MGFAMVLGKASPWVVTAQRMASLMVPWKALRKVSMSMVCSMVVPKVTEMVPGMALAKGSLKAMKAPTMEPLMGARMAPLIEAR